MTYWKTPVLRKGRLRHSVLLIVFCFSMCLMRAGFQCTVASLDVNENPQMTRNGIITAKPNLRHKRIVTEGLFTRIVLIIKFNYPTSIRRVAGIIEKWSGTFKMIRVCAPQPAETLPGVSVIKCEPDLGLYQSPPQCLLEAISGSDPGTEGWLYIHDDLVINVTNWRLKFDRSVPWITPVTPVLSNGTHRFPRWAENKESIQRILSDPQINQYPSLKQHFYIGYGDIAYVPRKQAADFIMAAQFLQRHNLWLEILMPTLFMLLEGTQFLNHCVAGSPKYRLDPFYALAMCKRPPNLIQNPILKRNESAPMDSLHPVKYSIGKSASEIYDLLLA